jgi:hypothetical protein
MSASEDIGTVDVEIKGTINEANGFDSNPVILAFKTREL